MQTLSDADELAVLQAQLLQWSYLNARADHAAQAQEETVQTRLSGSIFATFWLRGPRLTARMRFKTETELWKADSTNLRGFFPPLGVRDAARRVPEGDRPEGTMPSTSFLDRFSRLSQLLCHPARSA